MTVHNPQPAIHRFLKSTIGGLVCRFLGFSSACYAPTAGPMLIVANHNADLDPVFLSMAFREHMYFVASEHIFRWGLWSKLIVALFDPISRSKGMTDARGAANPSPPQKRVQCLPVCRGKPILFRRNRTGFCSHWQARAGLARFARYLPHQRRLSGCAALGAHVAPRPGTRRAGAGLFARTASGDDGRAGQRRHCRINPRQDSNHRYRTDRTRCRRARRPVRPPAARRCACPRRRWPPRRRDRPA